MKLLRLESRLGVLWALLLLSSLWFVVPAAVAANSSLTRDSSSVLFGGELGRWLEQQAIPDLVALIGKHPRFRGEQIRVVTMTDGLPTIAGNGLSHALRDRLTHQLTRVQGVQIAWQNHAKGCGVPRKSPYLLGVEIAMQSRSNALVTIAVVDVEEGVWVSGGYSQWRGVLTRAERAALSQAVSAAPVGSIDSPLPASEHKQISTLLLRQIECSLLGGLEGGVEVVATNPDDQLLATLAEELHESLVHSATVAVVNRSQSDASLVAEWRLELGASTDVGESVVATLSSEAAPSAQLAAVYVQRSLAANVASNNLPNLSAGAMTLIDAMHEVPQQPGDTCYRRSAECLEVQFELVKPSYLIVLRTRPGGAMSLGSCSTPIKVAGTKRYRMRTHATGAGLYALATFDQQLAQRLHGQLAAGARNCRERVRGDWLAELESTLAQADEPVDWQTFRLSTRLGVARDKSEAVVTAGPRSRTTLISSGEEQP